MVGHAKPVEGDGGDGDHDPSDEMARRRYPNCQSATPSRGQAMTLLPTVKVPIKVRMMPATRRFQPGCPVPNTHRAAVIKKMPK